MHAHFTTWTRRRGGITVHSPADKDREYLQAADAAQAAELHMAKHEDADVVAVKPASETQYFRRAERRLPHELAHVIEAEEIPPALEGGVDG